MFIPHRCIDRTVKFVSNHKHIVVVVLVAFITACSSSSGGSSQSDTTATEPSTTDPVEGVSQEDELSNSEDSVPLQAATTRVTFTITVPVYSSNALQVRLESNGIDLNARWVADESWTITEDFPNQFQHLLTISFNDANGAITLATFTTEFQADAVASQLYEIDAAQFDSDSWDTNGDGVSNLAEAIADNRPSISDVPTPVLATLALVPDKTFLLSWQGSAEAQYYRILENPDGLSGFTQVGEDVDVSVLSYKHRVALFKRVNASYIVQACNEAGCSDSTILTVPSSLESAITYVKATNTEVYDRLGVAVALTRDGNMMAIGAPGEDSASTQINGNQNDNDAGAAGAVYLFERVDGAWQQKDYIKASNAQAGDGFGSTVEISADGNTLVVGAPYEDSWEADLSHDYSGMDTKYGAVYIFTRNSGTWVQQSYLKPNNPTYQSAFGNKLSLSTDGNTLVVGTANENSGPGYGSGAAYVFVRTGDNWSEQAHLKASNAEAGTRDSDGDFYGGDNFGYAVALSGDGNTLAVGAPYEDSGAQGVDGDQLNNLANSSGAVYIFTRNGAIWQQQTYIKASNSEQGDNIGYAVSLSTEGDILAVYAPGEDSIATGIGGDQTDNSADNTGALYLFLQSSGEWQQQEYIKAGNIDPGPGFLTTRSFSEDGKVLATGTTVYVYRDARWQLQVVYQSISGNEKVYKGSAVVSGDGNTIVLGDPSDESSATGLNGDRYDYFGENSGAVYLY